MLCFRIVDLETSCPRWRRTWATCAEHACLQLEIVESIVVKRGYALWCEQETGGTSFLFPDIGAKSVRCKISIWRMERKKERDTEYGMMLFQQSKRRRITVS